MFVWWVPKQSRAQRCRVEAGSCHGDDGSALVCLLGIAASTCPGSIPALLFPPLTISTYGSGRWGDQELSTLVAHNPQPLPGGQRDSLLPPAPAIGLLRLPLWHRGMPMPTPGELRRALPALICTGVEHPTSLVAFRAVTITQRFPGSGLFSPGLL